MLGILRLVLALTVVAGHINQISGWSLGYGNHGSAAVEVFFVLSGFAITKAVRRNYSDGISGFGRFWINRAIRLLPTNFIALAIAAFAYPASLYNGWQYPGFPHWPWFSTLFFVGQAKLSGMHALSVLGSAWTLGIEVIIYLLLSAWAARSQVNSRIFLVVATMVALLGASLPFEAMYYGIVWQLFPFAIGCSVAIEVEDQKKSPMIAYIFLVLLLEAVWLLPARPLFLYYDAIFAVPLLLTGAAIRLPFDAFLGDLSYSVYLVQFPVFAALAPRHGMPLLLLALSTILVLGVAITLLVDRPIRHLRSVVRQGRATPPLTSSLPNTPLT